MAAQRPRPCPVATLLRLPNELQLRILEELSGQELCSVEASCKDFCGLLSSNAYLYQRALTSEYGGGASPKCSWKEAYMHTFVQARLDELEGYRRAYDAHKLKLEELDELLHQAEDVKALFASPDMLEYPSTVLSMVGDMEEDVRQQRVAACDDVVAAEAHVLALQREVQSLLDRVPLPRRWRNVYASGCAIA